MPTSSFEMIKKNTMVDCVDGGAKVEQHQQRACIAVHGKKKIVYHSGYSSFSGIESPKPRLKGFK